jgi:hypothetical protein
VFSQQFSAERQRGSHGGTESTEEFLFSFSSSTKSRSVIHGGEQFHLINGDFVEARETLVLAQSFANEEGIEIFQIRQAYQLGAGGLVADVAFVFRVRGARHWAAVSPKRAMLSTSASLA